MDGDTETCARTVEVVEEKAGEGHGHGKEVGEGVEWMDAALRWRRRSVEDAGGPRFSKESKCIDKWRTRDGSICPHCLFCAHTCYTRTLLDGRTMHGGRWFIWRCPPS